MRSSIFVSIVALATAVVALPAPSTTTCTETKVKYEGTATEYAKAPEHEYAAAPAAPAYDAEALEEWAGEYEYVYEAPAPAPHYGAPDSEYSHGGEEGAAPGPSTNYPDTSGSATDDFSKKCLEAHNSVRSKHQNTPPVAWSPQLASEAQGWASQCNGMNHGSTGENLYASTGSDDPSQGIQAWYDEVSMYSYGNPSFDYSTGHFTQVVWAGTKEIGCGIQYCPNAVGNSAGYLLVCRYQEPGNMRGDYESNVYPTY